MRRFLVITAVVLAVLMSAMTAAYGAVERNGDLRERESPGPEEAQYQMQNQGESTVNTAVCRTASQFRRRSLQRERERILEWFRNSGESLESCPCDCIRQHLRERGRLECCHENCSCDEECLCHKMCLWDEDCLCK